MKSCGIIIVGDEVIQGHIQDTNSRWIARRLTELGFDVRGIFICGDVVADIINTLSFLIELSLDLIFVCGGLGPTPDDKTVEATAKCFSLKLVDDKTVSDDIFMKISFLKEMHIVDIKPTKWITKMSRIPEGSIPLKNNLGLAPGIMLSVDRRLIFLLPGVPVEMKSIFSEEVEFKLGVGEKRVVKEVVLKTEESRLCDLVERLEDKYGKTTIGMYPRYGRMEVTLRIIGNETEASLVLMEIQKEAERLGVDIA